MVEPRFFVPLQTAIHRSSNTCWAIAFQHSSQQLGDHRLHLRESFPAGALFIDNPPSVFPNVTAPTNRTVTAPNRVLCL